MTRIAVCFVCTGNICRSPTAEGVFRALVERESLAASIHVDSAGTTGYHVGDLPDPRSRRAASARGVTLTHRARLLMPEDFARFDYLLAMDAGHLSHMERRAPADARTKIALLRAFDTDAIEGSEVPDPYYGETSDFEEVVTMVERACEGLLDHVRREHGLGR